MCKVPCCLVSVWGKTINMINNLKNLKCNDNYHQIFSTSCIPGTVHAKLFINTDTVNSHSSPV